MNCDGCQWKGHDRICKACKTQNYSTIPVTYMEQNTCNAPVAKKEAKGLDTQCRIHVHSKRHRLADSDGISTKAVIDGLKHAGILKDDSPRYVKEVSYSQEKTTAPEETIVDIYFDGDNS